MNEEVAAHLVKWLLCGHWGQTGGQFSILACSLAWCVLLIFTKRNKASNSDCKQTKHTERADSVGRGLGSGFAPG